MVSQPSEWPTNLYVICALHVSDLIFDLPPANPTPTTLASLFLLKEKTPNMLLLPQGTCIHCPLQDDGPLPDISMAQSFNACRSLHRYRLIREVSSNSLCKKDITSFPSMSAPLGSWGAPLPPYPALQYFHHLSVSIQVFLYLYLYLQIGFINICVSVYVYCLPASYLPTKTKQNQNKKPNQTKTQKTHTTPQTPKEQELSLLLSGLYPQDLEECPERSNNQQIFVNERINEHMFLYRNLSMYF